MKFELKNIKAIDLTEELSKLTLNECWSDGASYHYETETTLEFDLFDIDVKAKAEVEYTIVPETREQQSECSENWRDLYSLDFTVFTKDGEELDIDIEYDLEKVLKNINLEN